LKQSETKDQTGKGTKIKGSNYNLSEGLDYKIVRTSKDQIRNIHFDTKTASFQSTISSPFFTAVSADSGAISATKTADCFNYGECFTATIPLHAVTKPNVAPQGISLGYKSQRKTMKRGERNTEKKKNEREEGDSRKRKQWGEERRKNEIERETKRTGGNRGREKKRERRGDSEETQEERQIEEGRDRRTKKKQRGRR
jgi:hypothetical protein